MVFAILVVIAQTGTQDEIIQEVVLALDERREAGLMTVIDEVLRLLDNGREAFVVLAYQGLVIVKREKLILYTHQQFTLHGANRVRSIGLGHSTDGILSPVDVLIKMTVCLLNDIAVVIT